MTTLANLTTYISGESQSFLSAINESRGGLRSLIASLDPVAAATAKYNRQVDMLDKGLKANKLTIDQHGAALGRLSQRYQSQISGQTALTTSTGQARAGMQQLSFQLGDVATQFASGTKPMIIFAQQGGQVIQAIQLMTNSSKGFLGFLGGPWGQVLTAAAIVLSALTAKMFENADASKAMELANDGLSQAQAALGEMFDLTSGKLKRQNELMRLNVLLTAQQLKAEAATARIRAEKAAGGAEFSTTDKILSVLSRRGNMVAGAEAAGARISSTLRGVLNGTVPADKAMSGTNKGDLGILGIDQAQWQGALKDALEARVKTITADGMERTLKSGNLDPMFREEGREKKPKKGPKDKSEENLERFTQKIEGLRREQLGLLSGITADIREQADYEHQQIDLQRDQAVREVDQDKTINEAQKAIARKLIERNAELQHTQVNWKLDDQLTEQGVALKQAENDNAVAGLRGELQGARTQEQRRRIQLAILDREIELEREAQRAVMAKHKSTDVEYQIAESRLKRLDSDKAFATQAINRDTLSPIAGMLDQLPRTAEELNEAFENVAANGVRSLTDGLAEAIMQSKSLADVFKNVANQIIGDLLRIAIQRTITNALGNALGGLFDVGGALGEAIKVTKVVKAPGFASGGGGTLGGFPGIDRNVLSLNGTPIARVSAGEHLRVTPANDRGASGGVSSHIEVVPSPYFNLVVDGRAAGVAGGMYATGARANFRRGRQRLA